MSASQVATLAFPRASVDLLCSALRSIGEQPEVKNNAVFWSAGSYFDGILQAENFTKIMAIRRAYAGELARQTAKRFNWRIR